MSVKIRDRSSVMQDVEQLLQTNNLVHDVLVDVHKVGGRLVLVGGGVRDLFLGRTTKDIDVEVYGIALKKLELLLKKYGVVRLVGKSFGVLRVDGHDIDWAVPRKDNRGRKPQVELDLDMRYEDAFARRDLTVNAMGIDLQQKELIDPFNGLQDLQKGLLRSPDLEFFVQDPLRLFRVMQFIARFAMQPDDELNHVCSTMDVKDVSRERIEDECNKMLLKSARPSLGLRWLQKIDRLRDIFPELYNLIGVQQQLKWHPEGDVFEHTMQSIDAAATISQNYDNGEDKCALLYGAMCHDLGKAVTTKQVDGVWRSIGHAQEGVAIAVRLLKRITHNHELIAVVKKMVRYHMEPVQLVAQQAKINAYRRLAHKLAPECTMQLLADLSLADQRGRNSHGQEPLVIDHEDITTFLSIVDNLEIRYQPIEPLLYGRDIMDLVDPGPQMGRLLKRAYELQLDEGIEGKQILKELLKKEMEKAND